MPRTIQLNTCLPDEEVDKLSGTFMGPEHFDVLVDEDAWILRPDGQPLGRLVRGALDPALVRVAYPILRKAATATTNRGMAVGRAEDGRAKSLFVLKDGTIAKTSISRTVVESSVIGFYDRYIRTPYCRQTSFNLNNASKFGIVMPYIQAVDAVFRREMPERYAAQMGVVKRTHPEWVISGTSFTTITVNRNWQTALHQDQGDLPEGFGVMTAFRSGSFDGMELVFPKFRVAAVMRTGDVFLADVHQWHGNAPVRDANPGRWERVSCVFYYRKRMQDCGSAVEELERAKARKTGDPLWGDLPSERSDQA